MTNYLPVVIAAKYLEDYKIEVEFNNGEKRRVDCEKWLTGGIFTPLQDKAYFKQFFVDDWTIAWANGADIDPETLYEEGEKLIDETTNIRE